MPKGIGIGEGELGGQALISPLLRNGSLLLPLRRRRPSEQACDFGAEFREA